MSATKEKEQQAEKPRRRSRAERSEETRQALFQAAAEMVGEHGYAEASISRITARAKVAQGTFYNYFESRQDLFDQLLPALGEKMLAYIRGRMGDTTGPEREERRIRAYFDFLQEYPEFYRILYEAETLAPTAHKQHIEATAGGYTRALERSWERGEMPDFERRELEVIAYMLLAARGYLSMKYGFADDRPGHLPEWVVTAYMKFVRHGLYDVETPDKP
ncbi:TetR/AcrR family transcriptional regulator [Oceanibaculum pacificum]|uniref:Transcriptional regulator n=1 Tax=Oceanibaculum pacificum TaxID=580166 RepID=A0A154VW19_9PROT|nr:TetR/AcrR family transcriptional regulator [Oceanibaculum pacificum]KZD05504.1 transcriptional regulator [Oceanibaculum pacificum]